MYYKINVSYNSFVTFLDHNIPAEDISRHLIIWPKGNKESDYIYYVNPRIQFGYMQELVEETSILNIIISLKNYDCEGDTSLVGYSIDRKEFNNPPASKN
jgi:hypothetical protein